MPKWEKNHRAFRKFTIWQPQSLISEESLTSEPQFLCSPTESEFRKLPEKVLQGSALLSSYSSLSTQVRDQQLPALLSTFTYFKLFYNNNNKKKYECNFWEDLVLRLL